MILKNKCEEMFQVIKNDYDENLQMAVSLQDGLTVIFIYTKSGRCYEMIDGQIVEELSVVTTD